MLVNEIMQKFAFVSKIIIRNIFIWKGFTNLELPLEMTKSTSFSRANRLRSELCITTSVARLIVATVRYT